MAEPAPRSWIRPGVLLAGRWRVLRWLAAGGSADVFLAAEQPGDEPCVLKVPSGACQARATERDRFRRELEVLARVRHPSLVRVRATGEEQGTAFVVLPYLAGGTLADRLRARGRGSPPRLPAGDLGAWLPDVAAALDALADAGFAHRDVTPRNVLFDAADRAHLTDLGLSRAIAGGTSLTPEGFAVGTPAYLAPEQIRDLPCDGRTDQYALATLLHEVLTGRLPFPEASLGRLLLLKVRSPAPPLAASWPQAPAALGAALARGLALEPPARFPTCTALAGAVLEALRGGG